MLIQGRSHTCIFSLAACLLALDASGQTRADCERAYTPPRAQEGKDVIWVPTEDSMVGRMLELADVTAADKVYDLGSGDGKIVIAAAKRFGATGVGIEYDEKLVDHARCLAAAEGVAGRVTFIRGDIFETDFSDATVVTLYLTPQVNVRLLPMLLALDPGTRIVAYSFPIGDWQPDAQIDSFGDGSAFFFVVPADARGSWRFRPANGGEGFEVRLEQSFQMLAGAVGAAAVTGRLAGTALEFTFTQAGTEIRVIGTVDGDAIAATVVRDGRAAEYVASRN